MHFQFSQNIFRMFQGRGNALFYTALAAILLLGLTLKRGGSDFPSFPVPMDAERVKGFTTDLDIEDNLWHHLAALNVARGNGISVKVEPPYTPTMFRSPGTGVLAGISYLLVGEANTAYVFGALFLGSLVFLALSIRALFGTAEALCFAAAVALLDASRHLWASAMRLSAAPPLYFFLSLFVFLLIKAYQASGSKKGITPSKASPRKVYGLVFVAGLSAAAVALVRAEFLFLPIITAALVLLRRAAVRDAGLHVAKLLLAFFAGLCLLFGPWMVRNAVQFGSFSAGGRAGSILLHRAIAAEAVSRGAGYWDFQRRVDVTAFFQSVNREYLAQGHTSNELIGFEQMLSREAMKKILAHPFSYLSGSAEEFLCGEAFNPTRLLFLGDSRMSYFQKINGREPFYWFALTALVGAAIAAYRDAFGAALLFHGAVYYLMINALVNSAGCYYTTYTLEFHYAAFSIVLAAAVRGAARLVRARTAQGASQDRPCAG